MSEDLPEENAPSDEKKDSGSLAANVAVVAGAIGVPILINKAADIATEKLQSHTTEEYEMKQFGSAEVIIYISSTSHLPDLEAMGLDPRKVVLIGEFGIFRATDLGSETLASTLTNGVENLGQKEIDKTQELFGSVPIVFLTTPDINLTDLANLVNNADDKELVKTYLSYAAMIGTALTAHGVMPGENPTRRLFLGYAAAGVLGILLRSKLKLDKNYEVPAEKTGDVSISEQLLYSVLPSEDLLVTLRDLAMKLNIDSLASVAKHFNLEDKTMVFFFAKSHENMVNLLSEDSTKSQEKYSALLKTKFDRITAKISGLRQRFILNHDDVNLEKLENEAAIFLSLYIMTVSSPPACIVNDNINGQRLAEIRQMSGEDESDSNPNSFLLLTRELKRREELLNGKNQNEADFYRRIYSKALGYVAETWEARGLPYKYNPDVRQEIGYPVSPNQNKKTANVFGVEIGDVQGLISQIARA